MIKKLIFKYNKENWKEIEKTAKKNNVTIYKDLKEELEIEFAEKLNVLFTPDKNKFGKSIILYAIKYVMYPSKSSSDSKYLIKNSNNIISGESISKNPAFDKGVFLFNYDVEIEFLDGLKIKREFSFENEKFCFGQYSVKYVGETKYRVIKDPQQIFEKYYDWPDSIGFKTFSDPHKKNKKAKWVEALSKSRKLSSSNFLKTFDLHQHFGKQQMSFFSNLHSENVSKIAKESILYSIASTKKVEALNELINTVLESFSVIDEINSEIDAIEALRKKSGNKNPEVNELIKISREKISELDEQIFKWENHLNLMTLEGSPKEPTYILIMEILNNLYAEVGNTLKKGALIDGNQFLLNLVDYDKIIENKKQSNNENLVNFNNLYKELEKIMEDIKKYNTLSDNEKLINIINHDRFTTGGSDNIELNLNILVQYLNVANIKRQVPFMIIDNLASEKDYDWELVLNPLESIIQMGIFIQSFITFSNPNLMVEFEKKFGKVNVIKFEDNIFKKDEVKNNQ